MKISYATKTSAYHARNGINCQDKIAEYHDGCGFVVSVSDGAGSKPHAEETADLVTEKTIEYWKNIKLDINAFCAEDYLEFITNSLRARHLDDDSAGATIMFMAADERNYVIGHLGDGIIIGGTTEQLSVLSTPENGEIPNETFLIPSENVSGHFRVSRGSMEHINSIIMTTDGIGNLLVNNNDGKIAKACYIIAEDGHNSTEAELTKALGESLNDIFSKYSRDDLSIAVITPYL